ncbi:hypothetical protein BLOT_010126 [Blomia tropicalis]|nr:hypothetical protein BLOT_010126 [Blomia tropicalis]
MVNGEDTDFGKSSGKLCELDGNVLRFHCFVPIFIITPKPVEKYINHVHVLEEAKMSLSPSQLILTLKYISPEFYLSLPYRITCGFTC